MSMKDNLSKLMEEAQKMQAKMQDAQRALEQLVVIGTAGADLVKVEMTGRHYVNSVSIDASVVDPDDKKVLEDLVAAAFNDASKKIETETRGRMNNLAAGMNLPQGFDKFTDEE